MTGNLIPIEILKEAIFWSMKENLTIQFLYPDYELPEEYKSAIASTFHADIVSSTCEDLPLRDNADVVVFDTFDNISDFQFNDKQSYAIRTMLSRLLKNANMLHAILPKVNRMNVIITDIASIKGEWENKYAEFLEKLGNKVLEEYKKGHYLQINLLTDRLLLDNMNNCNAGNESITICPDGKFYACPAFYSDKDVSYSIGDLATGLNIKNPQLYKISHAPICRICDAFQCKRCVWLNRKNTLEVNTPSHEQCVVSHIERNASRKLLSKLREIGSFLPGKEIPQLDYVDPIEKLLS